MALESAWGEHLSGKNNFFGIKGTPGTVKTTWEDYGNGPVTIQATFKDFASPYECVDYLVTRWYKDYKDTKALIVLHIEMTVHISKSEGYATDPIYPQKLINLMNANA